MRIRLAAAVVAAACSAVGLIGTGTANAASPTLTSDAPLYTIASDAYNIAAAGPIHYAPHLHADCVGFPSASLKSFSLSIPGIGTVSLPASYCDVSGDTYAAHGYQAIAGANLLGGRIVVGALTSSCVADDSGVTTVGSSVATLNGHAIGSNPGVLSIPGVATVYFNRNTETVDDAGVTTMRSVALEVDVPAKTVTLLGKTYVLTAAQTITLGECSVSGYAGGGLD